MDVMILARPRKTIEDFEELPEGTLAELIDGEIYLMSPSPRPAHQIVVGNLYRLLDGFVRPRGVGIVLLSPLDVYLPSGGVVEPDLIYVAERNRGMIQDKVRGVPDLLIEVISPWRPERDRVVKRDLYARNGVPEYWIVDADERTVEVLALAQGRYGPRGYFREGETLVSPSLPGLEIQLREVFA